MAEQEERTVVGVFDDYATAQQAARELESDGVPRQAINIESNQKTGAAGYGGVSQGDAIEEHHEGGIKGFFHRLFGGDESDEGGDYDEALRRGNAILVVRTGSDNVDHIAQIMNNLGAVDIDRHADYQGTTGSSGQAASSTAFTSGESAQDREGFRNREGSASMPVIEEELQVGKRTVRRGGVRVYSHVVNQPVEEQVRLREEHVRVERRPANRAADAGDVARLRDQTIEVTESAEEPVVSKRARVREEVVIGKEVTERTETIRDNVRHTEVHVDNLGARDERTSGGTASNVNAGSGAAEATSPGYMYGSRIASDPRFTGRSWDDAEDDLRVDYMRNNPTSRWDEAKADIRRGWDKVTRKS